MGSELDDAPSFLSCLERLMRWLKELSGGTRPIVLLGWNS